MKNIFFDNFSKTNEDLITNTQKLNKLAVSNWEKVTTMQMATLRSVSDLSIKQFKGLTDVRDAAALQDFVKEQSEAVREIAEKVIADSKTVSELGIEYGQEAQKIAKANVEKLVSKAA